jgi:hypothetical protein
MAIYSQEIQDLTNQLVTQVATLQTDVAATPPDIAGAITADANAIQLTSTNLDTAITSSDIPPDGTMIYYHDTELLSQVTDLQTAVSGGVIADIQTATDVIVLTTQNLNTCVAAMAQMQNIDILIPPSLWFPGVS